MAKKQGKPIGRLMGSLAIIVVAFLFSIGVWTDTDITMRRNPAERFYKEGLIAGLGLLGITMIWIAFREDDPLLLDPEKHRTETT